MTSKKLLIILAIIQFYVGASGAPSSAGKNQETCDTKECRQIADTFSKSINKSADPCVDFYEFTCGHWTPIVGIAGPTKHSNRDEEFEYLALARLRGELESPLTSKDILPVQQAKQFYQSCMNNTGAGNGFQRLISILQNTNGWPMIMSNGTWNESMSWQEVDRYHVRSIGHALYTASLHCPEKEEKTAPYLRISNSPPPSIFHRINFMDHTQEFRYRSIIESTAKILIKELGTGVSDEELEKDIDKLITFEKRLRQARSDRYLHKETKLYSSSKDTDIFKFNGFMKFWNNRTELIARTPKAKINWYDELQKESAPKNISINGNTEIKFREFGYFIDLIKLLESTDARTIINFIQWKFVITEARYLSEEIQNSIYEKERKILGVSGQQPRWYKCINAIGMMKVNMHIFAKKYYPNRTNEAVHKMISNLKESLQFQIMNSNFPNKTVLKMKKKLNQMEFLIGYPDWLRNETAIINYYKGLTIGNEYFDNALNYEKFEREVNLRSCQSIGSVTTGTWHISSLSADAHYDTGSNSIRLSAGGVQSPLFGPRVPNYINYGIVGSIIGHEMGHAYEIEAIMDDRSRTSKKVPEDGDDRKIYTEHIQSFINFFDKYFKAKNITLKLSGVPTDAWNTTGIQKHTLGSLTSKENVADWIGIQAAFHAYKKTQKKEFPNGELKLPGFLEYNDLQMFFISFAQQWCEKPKTPFVEASPFDIGYQHSPNHLRINGPLFNVAAFSDTFECKKRIPNYPKPEINFWNGTIGQIKLH